MSTLSVDDIRWWTDGALVEAVVNHAYHAVDLPDDQPFSAVVSELGEAVPFIRSLLYDADARRLDELVHAYRLEPVG